MEGRCGHDTMVPRGMCIWRVRAPPAPGGGSRGCCGRRFRAWCTPCGQQPCDSPGIRPRHRRVAPQRHRRRGRRPPASRAPGWGSRNDRERPRPGAGPGFSWSARGAPGSVGPGVEVDHRPPVRRGAVPGARDCLRCEDRSRRARGRPRPRHPRGGRCPASGLPRRGCSRAPRPDGRAVSSPRPPRRSRRVPRPDHGRGDRRTVGGGLPSTGEGGGPHARNRADLGGRTERTSRPEQSGPRQEKGTDLSGRRGSSRR